MESEDEEKLELKKGELYERCAQDSLMEIA